MICLQTVAVCRRAVLTRQFAVMICRRAVTVCVQAVTAGRHAVTAGQGRRDDLLVRWDGLRAGGCGLQVIRDDGPLPCARPEGAAAYSLVA